MPDLEQPAVTAGEQDHSDPAAYTGEPAEAPTDDDEGDGQ